MTDIKSLETESPAEEEALRQAIELLFFAYRDFTSDPDDILMEYGFGRAHHRVIHFVGRHPGITVAELLAILRITKQSLSRVLRQLIQEGFIVQRREEADKRQRHLHLTELGRALERRLSAPQRTRLARAIDRAGAEAFLGYRKILESLIDDDTREEILERIRKG